MQPQSRDVHPATATVGSFRQEICGLWLRAGSGAAGGSGDSRFGERNVGKGANPPAVFGSGCCPWPGGPLAFLRRRRLPSCLPGSESAGSRPVRRRESRQGRRPDPSVGGAVAAGGRHRGAVQPFGAVRSRLTCFFLEPDIPLRTSPACAGSRADGRERSCAGSGGAKSGLRTDLRPSPRRCRGPLAKRAGIAYPFGKSPLSAVRAAGSAAGPGRGLMSVRSSGCRFTSIHFWHGTA